MTRPPLILQVDGTPGAPPRGSAGIGVVIRAPGGRVLFSRGLRAAAATNNEAEYQAVIAGLETVRHRFPVAAVRCLTDSQIVVEQLAGRSAVRAPALVPLHARAAALARQLVSVEFVLIPRELNQLADALAWEALDGLGHIVRSSHPRGGPAQREGEP